MATTPRPRFSICRCAVAARQDSTTSAAANRRVKAPSDFTPVVLTKLAKKVESRGRHGELPVNFGRGAYTGLLTRHAARRPGLCAVLELFLSVQSGGTLLDFLLRQVFLVRGDCP